jgi:hypothetical protein
MRRKDQKNFGVNMESKLADEFSKQEGKRGQVYLFAVEEKSSGKGF